MLSVPLSDLSPLRSLPTASAEGLLVRPILVGAVTRPLLTVVVVVVAGVIFLLGGTLQAACQNKETMLAGRFFAGVGIGFLGVLVPRTSPLPTNIKRHGRTLMRQCINRKSVRPVNKRHSGEESLTSIHSTPVQPGPTYRHVPVVYRYWRLCGRMGRIRMSAGYPGDPGGMARTGTSLPRHFGIPCTSTTELTLSTARTAECASCTARLPHFPVPRISQVGPPLSVDLTPIKHR